MKYLKNFIEICKEVWKDYFETADYDEIKKTIKSIDDAIMRYQSKKARILEEEEFVLKQYSDVYWDKLNEAISINKEVKKGLLKNSSEIYKMRYDGSDPSFMMWDNLNKRYHNLEDRITYENLVKEYEKYIEKSFGKEPFEKSITEIKRGISEMDNHIEDAKKFYGFSFIQPKSEDVPYMFAFMEKPVE